MCKAPFLQTRMSESASHLSSGTNTLILVSSVTLASMLAVGFMPSGLAVSMTLDISAFTEVSETVGQSPASYWRHSPRPCAWCGLPPIHRSRSSSCVGGGCFPDVLRLEPLRLIGMLWFRPSLTSLL